jgi:hypothetical protein
LFKFSLTPKDKKFAVLFEQSAHNAVKIAHQLNDMICTWENIEERLGIIADLEHEGDAATHQVMAELHRSFITPFDREDIYQLSHEFDDIVDLLENTLHNIYLYEVPVKKSFVDDFSVLIGKASIALNTLITELFKHRKYTDSIWKLIFEIHNLEDEGDLVYHRELRNLLNGEKDPILVIKWKDILTTLERIMDVYQNISNTVEGIIVKSS